MSKLTVVLTVVVVVTFATVAYILSSPSEEERAAETARQEQIAKLPICCSTPGSQPVFRSN